MVFYQLKQAVSVAYLNLALAVAFNVAAYAVFKAISDKEHTLYWALLFGGGLALGAINTFCFTSALRSLKLAVAYPVFSGASIAGVVAVSVLVFKEQTSLINLVGAGLVVFGIALLAR